MTTLFTKVTPCYTAVLAMAAVRLSQTGTVSKRMNISSCFGTEASAKNNCNSLPQNFVPNSGLKKFSFGKSTVVN